MKDQIKLQAKIYVSRFTLLKSNQSAEFQVASSATRKQTQERLNSWSINWEALVLDDPFLIQAPDIFCKIGENYN